MMKKSLIIFRITLAAFIFTGCQQPILNSGEMKFKKLSEYHLSDFNLGKNVRYFEIAKNGKQPVVIARYGIRGEINRHTVSNSVRNNKKTRNISRKTLSRNLQSTRYGMMVPNFFTLKYVNDNGEIFIITKISELKSFLGAIDTPAKLQLRLLTSGEPGGYSYKKSNGNFIVRWNFNRINDTGMCTHFSYQGVVDKNGQKIKTFNAKEPILCSRSEGTKFWK